MIFLIITLPMYIPVVIADEDDGINLPGDQCVEKSSKGQGYIDFMDSSLLKALELVSSILFMIATTVNTIDHFITLVNTVVGMQGPSPGTTCCTSVVGELGVCEERFIEWETWQNMKDSQVMKLIISVATCECCKDPNSQAEKAMGVSSAWLGGAGGFCPLGSLANNIGGKLDNFGSQISSSYYSPTQDWGSDSDERKGISQFHLSAFDNIYTAIGCMCPTAILFNLRKLKTIYQVYNCCVEEACEGGMSTEVCERQFDEATCMYWEGSLMKMLLKALASFLTGFISGMVLKAIEKLELGPIMGCIFLFTDLAQIPSRIQAMLGAFNWMTTTFSEPSCGDLGFDDIDKQLESGYWSQGAGISRSVSTTGNAMIYPSDDDYNSLGTGSNDNLLDPTFGDIEVISMDDIISMDTLLSDPLSNQDLMDELAEDAFAVDFSTVGSLGDYNNDGIITDFNSYTGQYDPTLALILGDEPISFVDESLLVDLTALGVPVGEEGVRVEPVEENEPVVTVVTEPIITPVVDEVATEPTAMERAEAQIVELNSLKAELREIDVASVSRGDLEWEWSGDSGETSSYEIQQVGETVVIAVSTPQTGTLETLTNQKETNHYVLVDGVLKAVTIDGDNVEIGETVSLDDGLASEVKSKMDAYNTERGRETQTRMSIAVLERNLQGLSEYNRERLTVVNNEINEREEEIKQRLNADNIEVNSDGTINVDGTQYSKNDDGDWVSPNGAVDDEVNAMLKDLERLRNEQQGLQQKQKDYGDIIQKIQWELNKQHAAYELTWRLLDFALEEFAFEYIDEMCQEDWEASEPATPPIDTSTGNPGSGGPGASTCEDHSFTAQLRIDGEDHRVTYTIAACYEMIAYDVVLKGTGMPDYAVADGYVAADQVVSDDVIIVSPSAYDEVCIESIGELFCFPAVAG